MIHRGKKIHILENINPPAQTAMCKNCGPVKITFASDRWRCMVGKKKSTDHWKEFNPEKHNLIMAKKARVKVMSNLLKKIQALNLTDEERKSISNIL